MSLETYRNQSREEIIQFLPQKISKILEIGCGEGEFARNIKFFTEKWGVEPNNTAAEIAKNVFTRILVGIFDAAKADLPKKYFDLVVCNDVIEHMEDHEKFLMEIQEYMTDDAVLVGSIPNVRYYRNLFHLLIVKDWEYMDWGTLDRTHLRFFTEKSLRRSLEKAGFEIEKFQGINGKIEFGLSKWTLAYLAFYIISRAISLGGARDISHLQFAFRARLRRR